jgi:hypothetical protein
MSIARAWFSLFTSAAVWVSPVTAETRATITVPIGTEIPLVTSEALSSKTSVKGDFVPIETAADVRIEGQLLIPAGTKAIAQVVDAQAKGAMGMSGRLAIRPLYLRLGDSTVRLGGASSDKGSVTAGAVIGMAFLTAGFTGRSAVIPKGSKFSGYVEHAVELPIVSVGPQSDASRN